MTRGVGILRAAGDGELETLSELLATDPALANAVGDNPYWGGRVQPLHLAITWDQEGAVDRLLEAGADPSGDNEGYGGWSPLLIAATRDRPSLVRRLLEAGALVGPFEAAALGDAGAVASALPRLAAGARSTLADGTTLLHVAGARDVAERLVAEAAEVDAVDGYGSTPLDSALSRAARGSERARCVVEALFASGASFDAGTLAAWGDVEALDRELAARPVALDTAGRAGRPPLLSAAAHGRLETVEWLLARGADPDARDRDGATALHCTAGAPANAEEIARSLLRAGATPDIRDGRYDATPADWADFQRRPDLRRVLSPV